VKNASNLVVLAMLSTQIPVIFFRRSENEIKQHAIMPVCRNKKHGFSQNNDENQRIG